MNSPESKKELPIGEPPTLGGLRGDAFMAKCGGAKARVCADVKFGAITTGIRLAPILAPETDTFGSAGGVGKPGGVEEATG